MTDLLDREFVANQLFYFHLLNVPKSLIQIIPPATLMATVFSLSTLARSHELVAMYSIGVSLKRVAGVILALVFLVCCFTLIMQDRILPPVFRKRMTYYHRDMKKEQDFFMDLKQDKIWYRSQNLIYNLKFFDMKTNTIHGMAVYEFDRDFNLIGLIEAARATHEDNGWKLVDGTVTSFSASDPFPTTQPFAEKTLKITETPKDFKEIDKEVEGLRIRELYRYIERTKEAGTDTKPTEVKFHSRISLSFIPLVMCLLGIPFSVRGRREAGFARDLGLSLGVTLFYWLFYSIGLSLGTNGALPPWLAAWLPSTIFAAAAVGLMMRLRV